MSASSAQLFCFAFSTMPTIVSHLGVPLGSSNVIRFPSGSSLGQCRLASRSLMTTTPGAAAPSCALKSRPRTSATPMVGKYPRGPPLDVDAKIQNTASEGRVVDGAGRCHTRQTLDLLQPLLIEKLPPLARQVPLSSQGDMDRQDIEHIKAR